ncbi:sensor histidine kinase [Propionispira raffinosivorans]|uniref:sensor histidine kinase n=1 Tax=Propionispira raffinosivorans TaxID=86959 RepID=UPI00036655B7|nr:sensor histidine kinase [Propionispira raffinosivorans]
MDEKIEEFSEKTLNCILRETVDAMENSKTQIFDIYEGARSEVEHIQMDIKEVKEKVYEVIEKVDRLEIEEQAAKQKLVRVSRNFKSYTESDIQNCYEAVKDVQIRLAIAREQEEHLRHRRDTLEIRLRKLAATVEKSKHLVVKIGVVLGYLSSQINAVVTQIEMLNQDKMLGVQVIKAQETERLRVSREIHDGPAQTIANLIYQSSICERMIDIDSDEAKAGLQEIRRQIRHCLGEVRRIIFDLRPMSLDDLGLVATVDQFLGKLKTRGNLSVAFNVEGIEVKINQYVEVSIFRIIQEALNNIYRHAESPSAELRLIYGKEYMSVVIKDIGKGFLVDQPHDNEEQNGCFGLMGMKERAAIIHGQLLIDSKPGCGTEIRLLVPLSEVCESDIK